MSKLINGRSPKEVRKYDMMKAFGALIMFILLLLSFRACNQKDAPTINRFKTQQAAGEPIVLTGTGNPGDSVRIEVDGKSIGTTTVDADGNWSLTTEFKDTDDHNVVVHVVDKNGAILASSAAISMAAFAPDILAGLDMPDVGNWDWNSGKLPALSGVGNPGEKIDIYDADGNLVGSTVVGPDGKWSLGWEKMGLNGVGDYKFSMKKYGADGSLIGEAELPEWKISGAAWTAGAPFALAAVGGAGLVAGLDMPDVGNWDWNSGKLPALSGVGNPGEKIDIYDADGNLVGSTVVGPDGKWSLGWDKMGLNGAGDYKFSMKKYGADGSLIGEAELPEWKISGAAWTAGAPFALAAVGGAGLVAGLDMPDVGNWDWNSGKLPALSGVGNPGEKIDIYDADGNLVGSTVVGSDGKWSLGWDKMGLNGAGDYKFSMKKYGADGSLIGEAELPEWKISGEAWTAGAPFALAAVGGAGLVAGLDMPDVGNWDWNSGKLPALSGVGNPGEKIDIYDADGNLVGSTVVGSDGKWSLGWDKIGLNGAGDYKFSMKKYGADGSLIGEAELPEWKISGAAWTAGAPFALAAVGTGGAIATVDKPEGAVYAGEHIFRGKGTPGEELKVMVDGKEVGTVLVDADGNWSYPVLFGTDGEHSVAVVSADGMMSEGQTVSVMSEVGVASATNSGADVMLSGTARPGSEIEILENGVVVGTVMADKDGKWSYSYKSNRTGQADLSARLAGADGSETAVTALSLPSSTGTGSGTGTGNSDGTAVGGGTASAAAPACTGVPGEDLGDRYVVAPCESLAKIAKRLDITLSHLLGLNPDIEHANLIYPGQILIVPPPDQRGLGIECLVLEYVL